MSLRFKKYKDTINYEIANIEKHVKNIEIKLENMENYGIENKNKIKYFHFKNINQINKARIENLKKEQKKERQKYLDDLLEFSKKKLV